jgi:hypothetical protein
MEIPTPAADAISYSGEHTSEGSLVSSIRGQEVTRLALYLNVEV